MNTHETNETTPHTGKLPEYLTSQAKLIAETTSSSGYSVETIESHPLEENIISTGEKASLADNTKVISEQEIENQPNETFYRKAQMEVRFFRAKIEE
jgi:hypothetical protein